MSQQGQLVSTNRPAPAGTVRSTTPVGPPAGSVNALSTNPANAPTAPVQRDVQPPPLIGRNQVQGYFLNLDAQNSQGNIPQEPQGPALIGRNQVQGLFGDIDTQASTYVPPLTYRYAGVRTQAPAINESGFISPGQFAALLPSDQEKYLTTQATVLQSQGQLLSTESKALQGSTPATSSGDQVFNTRVNVFNAQVNQYNQLVSTYNEESKQYRANPTGFGKNLLPQLGLVGSFLSGVYFAPESFARFGASLLSSSDAQSNRLLAAPLAVGGVASIATGAAISFYNPSALKLDLGTPQGRITTFAEGLGIGAQFAVGAGALTEFETATGIARLGIASQFGARLLYGSALGAGQSFLTGGNIAVGAAEGGLITAGLGLAGRLLSPRIESITTQRPGVTATGLDLYVPGRVEPITVFSYSKNSEDFLPRFRIGAPNVPAETFVSSGLDITEGAYPYQNLLDVKTFERSLAAGSNPIESAYFSQGKSLIYSLSRAKIAAPDVLELSIKNNQVIGQAASELLKNEPFVSDARLYGSSSFGAVFKNFRPGGDVDVRLTEQALGQEFADSLSGRANQIAGSNLYETRVEPQYGPNVFNIETGARVTDIHIEETGVNESGAVSENQLFGLREIGPLEIEDVKVRNPAETAITKGRSTLTARSFSEESIAPVQARGASGYASYLELVTKETGSFVGVGPEAGRMKDVADFIAMSKIIDESALGGKNVGGIENFIQISRIKFGPEIEDAIAEASTRIRLEQITDFQEALRSSIPRAPPRSAPFSFLGGKSFYDFATFGGAKPSNQLLSLESPSESFSDLTEVRSAALGSVTSETDLSETLLSNSGPSLLSTSPRSIPFLSPSRRLSPSSQIPFLVPVNPSSRLPTRSPFQMIPTVPTGKPDNPPYFPPLKPEDYYPFAPPTKPKKKTLPLSQEFDLTRKKNRKQPKTPKLATAFKTTKNGSITGVGEFIVQEQLEEFYPRTRKGQGPGARTQEEYFRAGVRRTPGIGSFLGRGIQIDFFPTRRRR